LVTYAAIPISSCEDGLLFLYDFDIVFVSFNTLKTLNNLIANTNKYELYNKIKETKNTKEYFFYIALVEYLENLSEDTEELY